MPVDHSLRSLTLTSRKVLQATYQLPGRSLEVAPIAFHQFQSVCNPADLISAQQLFTFITIPCRQGLSSTLDSYVAQYQQ